MSMRMRFKRSELWGLVADNVTIEHAEHLLNAFQDACLRDASLTGIGRGSRKLPQHFSCFDAVVPSAS